MKRFITIMILATALILPNLVFACTLVGIDTYVDCDGWTACFMVPFEDTVMETTLSYSVILFGGDGAILERFDEEVLVTRTEAGILTVEFCFSGTWEGYHDNPPFEVLVTAIVPGSVRNSPRYTLDCAVPNDDPTWDHVKSFYR